MNENQKEFNYNVLASPYISDQELSLRIQRNVTFVENYLAKIDNFFEHEIERQIAYREMGAIVYSSIEGILKAIVIEIDKRCENGKCSKKDCPYRNIEAIKAIHKIHTIDALLFLFDIRLFWLPPLEVDELRRLNYMRNFVHISKSIKDIIEDERFNYDYVEKMLKYYNKIRGQLGVSGYYFDKDNLCIGKIDEFAFEETKLSNLKDRRLYYEIKLDSCLRNLIHGKEISDEEIGALRMVGINEELALNKTSEFISKWLVDCNRYYQNEKKYDEDVNNVFVEMSKYISEDYMNKIKNSYNEIKEQNGDK